MHCIVLTALLLAGAPKPTLTTLSGAWFYPAELVDAHLAHRGDFIVRYSDSNPLTVHFDRVGHMDVSIGQEGCDAQVEVKERRGDTEVLSGASCLGADKPVWTWKWLSPDEAEVTMFDSTVRMKRLDKTRDQLEAEDAQDLAARTFKELAGTYVDGRGGTLTLTTAGEVKRSSGTVKGVVDWCGRGDEESRSGVCVVLAPAKGGPAVRVQKDGSLAQGMLTPAEELSPPKFAPGGAVWRRSK